MKKFAILLLALLLPTAGIQAGDKAQHQTPQYQIPRSEIVPITDSQTGREYDLYIRLPGEYAKGADSKHPVIYATDGAWHMEMLTGAAEYIMPNAILVVISWQKDSAKDFDGDARPHLSRFRDFTLVPHTNPEVQAKYNVGQARNHLTFIRDDVIKYVEASYQTDPAERTYFGFSLGGEFGSYILFEEPDTFKHYVLGSPSFNPESLKFVQDLAAQNKSMKANVFVSVGEKETEAIPLIEEFMGTLESEAGLNVKALEVVANSGHSEAFPATAVASFKWIVDLMATNQKGDE